MLFDTSSIARCLAATLALTGAVQALPAAEPIDTLENSQLVTRATIREDFNTFDKNLWGCEYTCPVIEGGKARFRLKSGVAPNQEGSWSKAKWKGRSFTSGRFTVSFSLTARPKGKVWWGVALWGNGPVADMSQFNEINFGYTTDQSFTNTQLFFESAKRGKAKSVKVDTGIDLYDEQYHTATLEYNADRVAFYLDGRFMSEITDKTFIPTDPMNFVLGPRLVTGGAPLSTGFTESVDWVEISY